MSSRVAEPLRLFEQDEQISERVATKIRGLVYAARDESQTIEGITKTDEHSLEVEQIVGGGSLPSVLYTFTFFSMIQPNFAKPPSVLDVKQKIFRVIPPWFELTVELTNDGRFKWSVVVMIHSVRFLELAGTPIARQRDRVSEKLEQSRRTLYEDNARIFSEEAQETVQRIRGSRRPSATIAKRKKTLKSTKPVPHVKIRVRRERAPKTLKQIAKPSTWERISCFLLGLPQPEQMATQQTYAEEYSETGVFILADEHEAAVDETTDDE